MRKDIVAVGYAGALRAAEITKKQERELRERFRSSFIDTVLAPEYGRLPEGFPDDPEDRTKRTDLIKRMREGAEPAEAITVKPERGFLGTAFDLAVLRKCGLRLEQKKIPILQSSVEILELYGENPYRARTEGFLLLAGDGYALAEELRRQELPAACIGSLTEGLDKLIVDKSVPEYLNRND